MTYSELLLVLIISLAVIHFRWILIFLVLPWQFLFHIYQRDKKNLLFKILAFPFFIYECLLFRGGWERWMLFQVAEFPSLHFRKFIYRLLGVGMEKNVVIHWGTEIRAPHKLYIGGVLL